MDEFDGIEDDLEFCKYCNLPMYPKDDPQNFMVFACRLCEFEDQRDYLFTLENKMINGIPVLPKVKDQEGDVCVPTALLTVLQTEIKTSKAELNEEFNQELSLADLMIKYKERVGIQYDLDPTSDHKDARANILTEILLEEGVPVEDNPEGKERFRARKVRHLRNQSFIYLASHILKGHPLKIKIPITKVFLNLMRRGKRKGRKRATMYIAKAMTEDAYKPNGKQIWHAVVLVGFGRKGGIEYFRYLNSHGEEFDDDGFGDLRASDIKEAFLIMI